LIYPIQISSRVNPLHLSTIAVVSHRVGASAEGTSDSASGGERLDTVGNRGGSGETLKNLEVQSKTSNVRAGHGGTADSVGGRVGADPGGEDVDTRAEDIDTSTVVGERSRAPAGVDGSNGQSVGSVGGRLARNGKRSAGVITVTGSNNREDTRVVGSVDGRGPGLRSGTAKRQVDNRATSTALGGDVVDSPVETSKDSGGRSLTASEDLDGDDVGLESWSVFVLKDCRIFDILAWRHRR
jgi:hypothetical protein